ncbi:hypothetical protein GCM10019017_23780 [Streptomyces showdoensis]
MGPEQGGSYPLSHARDDGAWARRGDLTRECNRTGIVHMWFNASLYLTMFDRLSVFVLPYAPDQAEACEDQRQDCPLNAASAEYPHLNSGPRHDGGCDTTRTASAAVSTGPTQRKKSCRE